ncbi:hypothetical protein MITS9508_02670 [Synechococcus sp. MIT S9508]|nr:hypothetical protein MITS9508_02670 [Synechococcus sp. MIT S9508]
MLLVNMYSHGILTVDMMTILFMTTPDIMAEMSNEWTNNLRKRKLDHERLQSLSKEAPDRQTFLQWRSPRPGRSNPENLTNQFWVYAIRHGGSSWGLSQDFGVLDEFQAGPCFSFQRYGQAKVILEDGRRVLIGGAHEDFYDPGFWIYNDVVVIEDDKVTIYGYPLKTFPPTDYASATLVGNEIWIIGNLGYREHRDEAPTKVFILNTNDWSIRVAECHGNSPGSIWSHCAELSSDGKQLLISSGECHCKLVGLPDQSLINPSLYVLNLENFSWTMFSRESKCREWQVSGISERMLSRSFDLNPDTIPNSNMLKNLLPFLQGGLQFRIPCDPDEDDFLTLTVQDLGHPVKVRLQGEIENFEKFYDLQKLLNDLLELIELNYGIGPLKLVPMERQKVVN